MKGRAEMLINYLWLHDLPRITFENSYLIMKILCVSEVEVGIYLVGLHLKILENQPH